MAQATQTVRHMPVSILTNTEAEEWCRRQGVVTKDRQPDESTLDPPAARFRIPEDAGKRIALARLLFPDTWTNAEEVLLWTTAWSIWPSGEHMPLFDRLRSSLNDPRSLDEANAHLVAPDAFDDGTSILVLNALFLWDCWVLTPNGAYTVFLSHDAYGVVYSRQARDDVRATLAHMDLLIKDEP